MRPRIRTDLSVRSTRRWLIAIVLIAGVLRFTRLGFPPPLTDEAFTFWRTCGSLSSLFDTLRYDGFMPLHYEIVWLLTRFFGHSIWVLRLPAALCGTAFPFAVYLVGRPLAGRRAAVLAAGMTAASAFFAYFERDAKMYAPAWVTMTFAVAFLLRFSLTGRRWWWLLFVFFGVASSGVYALPAAVLAVSPIIAAIIAKRHRIARSFAALAGTAIVVAAPIVYYTTLNHWLDTSGGLSNSVGNADAPHDNGLMWIEWWQGDRTPANSLLSSLSSYLYGYEWPSVNRSDVYEKAAGRAAYRAAWWGMSGIGLVVVIAAVCCSIVQRHRRRRTRAALLLAVLIAVPLYGFYLRSYPDLLPPWSIPPGGIATTIGLAILLWLALTGQLRRAIRSRAVRSDRRQLLRAALAVAGVFGMLLIAWACVKGLYDHEVAAGALKWNKLWMPRYAGIVAPFLVVLLAAALMKVPMRGLRWLFIAGYLGINLALSLARVFTETEWPCYSFSSDEATTITQADTRIAMSWLRVGSNDDGLPGLPSPYYELVDAAGVEIDPPGFRDGATWPYQPGPTMVELLDRVKRMPTTAVRRPKNLVGVNRIFYWRSIPPGGVEPPAIPGFTLVARESHHIRGVWTWTDRGTYERLEFIRDVAH